MDRSRLRKIVAHRVCRRRRRRRPRARRSLHRKCAAGSRHAGDVFRLRARGRPEKGSRRLGVRPGEGSRLRARRRSHVRARPERPGVPVAVRSASRHRRRRPDRSRERDRHLPGGRSRRSEKAARRSADGGSIRKQPGATWTSAAGPPDEAHPRRARSRWASLAAARRRTTPGRPRSPPATPSVRRLHPTGGARRRAVRARGDEDHLWILSCSGTLFRDPQGGPGEPVTMPLGGEVLSLDGLVAGSADRCGR